MNHNWTKPRTLIYNLLAGLLIFAALLFVQLLAYLFGFHFIFTG